MSYSLLIGDCRDILKTVPDNHVDCVVTSPPYFGLRDYGNDRQMGLETNREEYVAGMVEVFREVRRVLKPAGTLWLNIADSYNAAGRKGHGATQGLKQQTLRASALQKDWVRPTDPTAKPKELLGIPWRLALALSDDGWYLRQDIIWSKPNPMPESVKDRATKAHEYLFMFSKSERYYFDYDAFQEPARNGVSRRNRRSVWELAAKPYKGGHFATFPAGLVLPAILAGSPKGGIILDPFGGSGTVAGVAEALGRDSLIIELNPEYSELVPDRIQTLKKELL